MLFNSRLNLKINIASLLLFLFLEPVYAEVKFNSQAEFNNWFSNYYQHPAVEKIVPAICYIDEHNMLDKNHISPIFGFLAGVFKEEPTKVDQIVAELNELDDDSYLVVILGVWYASIPDSKDRVYAMLEGRPKLKEKLRLFYKGEAPDIVEIPLEQGPWVLDALWGNFMATGDKEPVVRIMQALPWLDLKDGNIKLNVIAGAARWSLTSNAIQHKRVMEICEQELSKQPLEVQTHLKLILAKVREQTK